MSEIPVHSRPRRLVDWINPTGARKVHSLIDKVYQRKNLEMVWEMVKANRGSGGVDGQSLDGFAAQLDQQLDRLHRELKDDVYRPQPVRQVQIPKAGKPGEFRTLGITDDLRPGTRNPDVQLSGSGRIVHSEGDPLFPGVRLTSWLRSGN